MKSIVLIFPYFGTLPVQYKMWRASAIQNPSINSMFFTDADVEPAENTNSRKWLIYCIKIINRLK